METNLQSNEVRIPKSPQSPGACPQFKSTFARSLSFNTNNQQPNKPLDFELNFRTVQHATDHLTNINGSLSTKMTPPHKINDIEEDFEEFMRNSPLKHSLQNGTTKLTTAAAAGATTTTTTTPTATPTRKNATTSRVFNATCSGRHRFQVTLAQTYR